MIDAQATTFVLILDPNDGYDEVWAFANEADAAKMVSDNNAYYDGGRYDGIESAYILKDEELAYFLDNYELPSKAVASGDYTPFGDDADDEDVEANDAELDAWYNDNRDVYAVDTPEFEARANGEYEEEEEEEEDEE